METDRKAQSLAGNESLMCNVHTFVRALAGYNPPDPLLRRQIIDTVLSRGCHLM
jgi:hypothetical protein